MFKNLSVDGLGISGRQSEVIELALSFGFKGTDLDILDFSAQVTAQGLAHARRLVDSARLKYASFRLPLIWDDDDETYRRGLGAVPKLLELAAAVGCKRCLTTVAPANDLRPYHENFEFHRRRLSEIAEMLSPHGIRLGIGFVAPTAARKDRAFQFIHSLDALILLTGMMRATNIGMVLDLWHMHLAGSSLDEMRKLPADRIIAVNVSDAPVKENGAEFGEDARLLPGETGVIDTAAALVVLAEMGYDGPITPTAHPNQLRGMRRDAIVKLAGERLDQAWKAAGLNPAGKLGSASGKK